MPAQVSLFGGEAGRFRGAGPASPAIGRAVGRHAQAGRGICRPSAFISPATRSMPMAMRRCWARRGVASWSDLLDPWSAMRASRRCALPGIVRRGVRRKLSKNAIMSALPF